MNRSSSSEQCVPHALCSAPESGYYVYVNSHPLSASRPACTQSRFLHASTSEKEKGRCILHFIPGSDKKKKGYLAILYAAYACKCDANARLKKKRCGVTQHAVGQSVSQITVTARSSRMPAAHAAGPGCREPETDCGARR